jgi:hypothetical protein
MPAVFSRVSETFIADHARALAPGRTMLVCMDSVSAQRFAHQPPLTRLAEFFRARNVTVVLGEFDDMEPMLDPHRRLPHANPLHRPRRAKVKLGLANIAYNMCA